MSRITLSKPSPSALQIKPVPFHAETRWVAPHESTEPRLWPNIFMTRRAFLGVNEHAASQLDLETGGMLIGEAFMTPENTLAVAIDEQIEARYVVNSSVHLTFTSKTLSYALDQLDERHPGKQIVGWYHTHPGLSIFLSSMDIWLHTNFFREPWHVALVIDPYVHHGGFFHYASSVTDYIHPKRYVGYHELPDSSDQNIANWYNLAPDTQVVNAASGSREEHHHEP